MRFRTVSVFLLGVTLLVSCRLSDDDGENGESETKPAEVPKAVERKPDDQTALERIAELGGKVAKDRAGSAVSVDLSNTSIGDDDMALLTGLPYLEQLNLNEAKQVTAAGLEHLKAISTLRVLRLRRVANNDGVSHLTDLPNLVVLDLFLSDITDDGLVHVAGMKKLKELDLRRTKLTDAEIAHLKNLTSLRNLKLQESERIGEASLDHLQKITNLERLGLQSANFSDTALEKIKTFTKLKSLELDDSLITDDGLKNLSGLANLEVLHCRRCPNLSGSGLVHMAGLTKMKRLMFRDTYIEDPNLVHLKGMKLLDKLELSETLITDEGLIHLGGLTNITWLSLWRLDGVTDVGLAHLKNLTKLKDLNLDGTRISDEGLDIVKEFPNLEALNLGNTGITDSGLEKLHRITKLKKLDLSFTQVSNKAVAKLQELLPDCEITQ